MSLTGAFYISKYRIKNNLLSFGTAQNRIIISGRIIRSSSRRAKPDHYLRQNSPLSFDTARIRILLSATCS